MEQTHLCFFFFLGIDTSNRMQILTLNYVILHINFTGVLYMLINSSYYKVLPIKFFLRNVLSIKLICSRGCFKSVKIIFF